MADNKHRSTYKFPLRRSELPAMKGKTVWVEILNPKAQKVVGTKHDFGTIWYDPYNDEFWVEILKYKYILYGIGYGDVWVAYRSASDESV